MLEMEIESSREVMKYQEDPCQVKIAPMGKA